MRRDRRWRRASMYRPGPFRRTPTAGASWWLWASVHRHVPFRAWPGAGTSHVPFGASPGAGVRWAPGSHLLRRADHPGDPVCLGLLQRLVREERLRKGVQLSPVVAELLAGLL